MFLTKKKVQGFLLILALALSAVVGLSMRHSEAIVAQPFAQKATATVYRAPSTAVAQQPAQTGAQFKDATGDKAIRPFRINVPEAALVDLRTKDEMLDDIRLYWLTNSAISSAQLYWENNANNFNAVDISIPAAVTVFPGEIYRAPRSWSERSYHKLIYFHEVDKGGHFAAWEQPTLFAAEIRAAFRSLR
ncbi:hypothetical protein [Nostoc sp.]|uniref:hypothetical protein n=1 Tax=Nostoc sp. TaxID=1180 RepID=UPI002FFC6EBD